MRKEGMGEERNKQKKSGTDLTERFFVVVKGPINNGVKVERGYATTNNYDNSNYMQSVQILLCVLSST